MQHAVKPAKSKSPQSGNLEIPAFQAHPSRAELAGMGKALRDKCLRVSHAKWKPPHDRPDPVQLIELSDKGRIPELMPLRHGRMLVSPFTFYRGAALNMAVDLASMPTTNIRVQCCGDAHLVNFRGFATPERRVQFDIHDLDETLPAPWEWDLKRLAASFVIACRDNGLGDVVGADAAGACARSYREHMVEYGKMRVLDVWYDSLDVEDLLTRVGDEETRRRAKKRLQKERERSALEHDFPELAHKVGGKPMIKDSRPTIYHSRKEEERYASDAVVRGSFASTGRACGRPCVQSSTTLNSRTGPSKWSVSAAWAPSAPCSC